MGNNTSTEQSQNADIEASGIDERPIDKETRQKLVTQLEDMLSNSLNSEIESIESIESKDLTESPSKVKVSVDHTKLLQAIIRADHEKYDRQIQKLETRLSNVHNVKITILNNVIRKQECEINNIKSINDTLINSSERWRKLYYDSQAQICNREPISENNVYADARARAIELSQARHMVPENHHTVSENNLFNSFNLEPDHDDYWVGDPIQCDHDCPGCSTIFNANGVKYLPDNIFTHPTNTFQRWGPVNYYNCGNSESNEQRVSVDPNSSFFNYMSPDEYNKFTPGEWN
jgi:hypothetical protein